jgi:fructoselysine 6-kinase
MSRILAIGDNTVDTYVSSRLQYPGGNAVNVAALTRRLGADSAYLGCVGSDVAGDLVQHALRVEKVDVSRVRVRHGPNARAFIAHEDGDRRFLGSYAGVRAQYALDDDDFDYAAGFDLAHTSIYSGLDHVLARLGAAPGLLSYDYSNRWDEPRLEATLPLVDVAFLSAPDLDDARCRRLLQRCLQLGAAQAVVTRGALGAMAADASGVHVQPAVPCEVVDTLGAGDAFISAFLLARLDGAELPRSLAAGAEFAARACGWPGGFGHGEAWNGEGAHWLDGQAHA